VTLRAAQLIADVLDALADDDTADTLTVAWTIIDELRAKGIVVVDTTTTPAN
jgi:hypothetical protein